MLNQAQKVEDFLSSIDDHNHYDVLIQLAICSIKLSDKELLWIFPDHSSLLESLHETKTIEGEGYDPENAINANFERVLNQLKKELIEPDFRR